MRLERLTRIPRRRPAHVCLGAAVAGLAVSPAGARAVLALAAATLLFALLAAIRLPRVGLLAVAALFAGVVLGSVRIAAIDEGRRLAPPGTLVAGRAVLLEHPRTGPFGQSALVELSSGQARGTRLLARGASWPRGSAPGMVLAVRGTVRRPRPPPAGGFDFDEHLRRRGVAGELRVHRLDATPRRRGGIAGALDGVRTRAERGIAAGLPAEEAALARGLVLGQDERISEATREDFRSAGLGHVLAVSGQNVALLVALVLPIAIAVRLGPRARVGVLLGAVAVYVPLAGAGPPLQRAGVMAAAGLCALLADRPASRAWALGLAAAVTLGLNPRVSGDPGWQLSFAAVTGMLLLGPGLRRAFSALPAGLGHALALTVAATLATLPLAAFHFGRIPLLGLPANLLALPALGPVMWLGTLQAVAGQLGPPGQAVAAALGHAGLLPLRWLEAVARRFGEARGAELHPPEGSLAMLALGYGAIAAVALGARAAHRRLEPERLEAGGAWRRTPRARRRAAVALAVCAACWVLLRVTAIPAAPDRVAVTFLDVGQGDATLVQSPDGAAVLFDGGPPEARVARLLRHAGVRRLSAVVATHQSRDHQGGLADVVRRFPVDLFVDGGDGTDDPAFLRLQHEVRRRGIRSVPARAGLSIRAGSLSIRLLGPPPRPPGPPPDDPNGRGAVALVSSGELDLFLSADAESPALSALPLPDVDVMKVPHHGSADPGMPELLRRLRPELAAIHVGERNTYGHPAPQTVAALEEAVPRVYRTDRHGTIRIEAGPGGVTVHTGH